MENINGCAFVYSLEWKNSNECAFVCMYIFLLYVHVFGKKIEHFLLKLELLYDAATICKRNQSAT